MSFGASSGGGGSIQSSSDVFLSKTSNKNTLIYDSSTAKWVNKPGLEVDSNGNVVLPANAGVIMRDSSNAQWKLVVGTDGTVTASPVGGGGGTPTITLGTVTANVSGTSVSFTGTITTSGAVQFDGLNISVAQDTTNFPWVASTAVSDGVTVNGTRTLSGSLTLSAGSYVAYVSYSRDDQATWTTGPRVSFTVSSQPGGGGSTTYPAKEIAVYNMSWSNSGAALSALPAKTNVIRLAFATQGSGQLRMVGYGPEGKSAFLSTLATRRSGGAKIIASIGGAGYPIDLSNTSARVSDIVYIANDLGGLDGIDIDIEASTLNQSHVLSFAAALKSQFGANFAISMAPNGSNVSTYLTVAVALHNAGNLDSYGQQFYDAEVSLAAAKGRIQQALDAGLPASKIAVGMMVGSSSVYWTNAQCRNYMTDIRDSYGITKAYLWENSRAGTSEWVNDMATIFGV